MPEAPRRTQPSSATKRRTQRGALCRAQPLTQRPPQLRHSRAPSAETRWVPCRTTERYFCGGYSRMMRSISAMTRLSEIGPTTPKCWA